ncbi:MAG: chemotaxis protein [Hyphomicrobiales bacterium]|nr:chemotaxis protein [Hyphomicrobiales bacterium]
MNAFDDARIARLADYMREKRDRETSLTEVMSLAEVMADSLHGFFEAFDASLSAELIAISQEIAEMKLEIGQLRPGEIRDGHIPDAGRELDAVVDATETATHTIMEAAEAIMSADAVDPAAYKDLVDEKVIEIFEACSFQDITGQRITKVVETLQASDRRVSRFADRLKMFDCETGAATEEECARAKRKRELILHGPQHEGEGVSQDDVDAFFSGAASQDDIDKLFD